MTISALITLMHRDLGRLKNELESYNDEANLWKLDGDLSNTAGNLALHLVGNLNHFIGAQLGNTGYVRDRPAEFADTNVPRSEIIAGIDAAAEMIGEALGGMLPEDMGKEYPLEIFGKKHRTGDFLMHLYGHLNYHLGQINYHRRLLD